MKTELTKEEKQTIQDAYHLVSRECDNKEWGTVDKELLIIAFWSLSMIGHSDIMPVTSIKAIDGANKRLKDMLKM